MSSTITMFVALESLTCGHCGVPFALEKSHLARLQADGSEFYCPNGHRVSYRESGIQRAEKAAKRAQELLDQERRRTEQLRADVVTMDNRRKAEAAAKTRIKNRVARGICPCCNRSFENLARHMKSKHPDELNQPK